MKIIYHTVVNIVGKGENVICQHFLLYSLYFQRAFSALEFGILLKRVTVIWGVGGGVMVRGRDLGQVSWGKVHRYRGKFTVRYLGILLIIFET